MVGRRKDRRWLWRAIAGLALLAMLGGFALWWHMAHWTPERSEYAMQGIEVGTSDGRMDWAALKATGVDFAYLDASASAFARDDAFTSNLEAARKAEMRVGAVHRYDPCQPADKQAANFVTVVPRMDALLPPAIELATLADACLTSVPDAEVESELMTFLNQVESHTGKPAILKLLPDFESRYGIAARIDRNLWLVRDRLQPDYAGRPWTLWTANTRLRLDVADEPVRWLVVRP